MSDLIAEFEQDFESRHTIASILAPIHVPEGQAGHVRADQLNSVDKLGVISVLTLLLNTAMVLVLFSGTETTGLLGLWASVLCIGCAVLFMRTVESLEQPVRFQRSQSAARVYTITCTCIGAWWGLVPVLVLPNADAFGQMALGVILSGLIFGGAVVMSRLPSAAYGFTLPVAGGMVAGFLISGEGQAAQLSMVAVVYATVTAVCVRWNYNQFVAQHLNKAAVAHQNALIGLLLRDFEESTSDWLWQTGPDGVLQTLPLALKGGQTDSTGMFPGRRLLSLFAKSEARMVLETSLRRKEGFRDITLRVEDETGGRRWWKLTGKPIVENGDFAGYRGVSSDVTASKQIEDRIAFMAHYDGLTGLPNRASFQEKFERIWGQTQTTDLLYAVVLMDLDNFKWVNDTLGHASGDELLRQLGRRVSGLVERGDLVARLGGDEFALIIRRKNGADMRAMLNKMIEELGFPYDIWGSTANCSASMGVRVFKPGLLDPETLMSHADLALYQAKHKGKSTWCLFTRDLDEDARARRVIEADLHRALSGNELHLAFQPIISSKTGKVASCETLLRWTHPERGEILPGQFIEHAEDCGLIPRLGEWVIREALSEARRLPDDVHVSVNLSPLQLHSNSLVSTIVNALAQNGIAPNRLDLEITETVLLSDTDFVLERLKQLRDLGLTLSLDDFGTGFSSLSYLRNYPFDKMKIDKSFVSDLETNIDNQAITKATIHLARSLGLKCTAEGVETPAQRTFLEELGCDELQGFLISKAKPLDELSHLMEIKPADAVPKLDNTTHLEPKRAPEKQALRKGAA
ncbi:MAG: EAL domain-containing protein [Pseudomonadota bacterium]